MAGAGVDKGPTPQETLAPINSPCDTDPSALRHRDEVQREATPSELAHGAMLDC